MKDGFWPGVAAGIAGIVITKYFILGHDDWDELLKPLHDTLPNRKPDCNG